MADNSINGIFTLAVGNLVVMLLAVSVRQQWRRKPDVPPSLTAGIAVLGVHLLMQAIAVGIARNFIDAVPTLTLYAAVFAATPTAWCILLFMDWARYRRELSIADAPPPADVLVMETARRYVVWGEYENARRAYLAYAQAHPKSPEPLFGLEGMYLSQGRYRDAADMCRQIMERFDHDVLTWTKAASRLVDLLDRQLNRPEEAADVQQAIARRNPAHRQPSQAEPGRPVDEATLVNRIDEARALAQGASKASAIAILKDLNTTNPRDPRPLFELALVLEADLQTEAALRTLERLVRDFSGNPGTWAEASMKLADLYLNRYGNESSARDVLERVAEKSPLAEHRAAAQERLEQLDNPWA